MVETVPGTDMSVVGSSGIVRRVSWGAIFAGVVVALSVQLLLSILGMAIGFGIVDPAQDADPLAGIGIGAGIWLLASALVALFLGGWTAGRLAGIPLRTSAMLHGIVVWGLGTLLTFWLISSALGSLIGGTAQIVGNVLGAAGQGIASAAGAVVDQGDGGTQNGAADTALDRIRQQARDLLNRSNAGAIVQQGTEDILRTPGDAGQDLDQMLDRLRTNVTGTMSGDDRAAAIDLLITQTGMSRAEAERTVANWERELQQAKAQAEQTAEQAKQQAIVASEKATNTLASAMWWTLLMLVVGLVAAAIGGAAGAPKTVYVTPGATAVPAPARTTIR